MELNVDWRREASALWPEVTFEIRPLKVWAFQELLTFWGCNGNQGDGQDQASGVVPAAGVGLIEVAKRIFPEHLRDLRGITLVQDGSAKPATLDALCEETALLKLAVEIVSRLMAISEITRDEEKN